MWLLRQIDVNQGDSIRQEMYLANIHVWHPGKHGCFNSWWGELAWPIAIACQLALWAISLNFWSEKMWDQSGSHEWELHLGPWDYLVPWMPSICLVYHGYKLLLGHLQWTLFYLWHLNMPHIIYIIIYMINTSYELHSFFLHPIFCSRTEYF